MNLWGDRARHVVISGDPDALGARAAIDASVSCDFPVDVPALRGRAGVSRYRRWARYMRGFDLVLTYNWGAMDAVMAHRIASPFIRLPPLVHHEDGFNQDEADRLKPQRNLFRRVALGSAAALVVPSATLASIAMLCWGRQPSQVRQIVNGIDVDAYAAAPSRTAIPGFRPDPGTVTVGTLAGLRAVKNLPRLVRAVAPMGNRVRLVIAGDGPEREAIVAQARAVGFDGLVLPGFLTDPWKYIGLFDIFALSSDSEQFPIALVQAMSAGLPVAATDVGDVADMVAVENAPFIVPRDEAALTTALARLISDAALRREIGEANRRKAHARYREEEMAACYADVYEKAMGRPGVLGGPDIRAGDGALTFSMRTPQNLL